MTYTEFVRSRRRKQRLINVCRDLFLVILSAAGMLTFILPIIFLDMGR